MIPGIVAGYPVAGGSGTTHRYWRCRVTAVQSATGAGGTTPTSCAELGLRDTSGGPSIATGGVASASTFYNSTQSADKAFDGNPATLWSTTSSNVPHWLAYDFGAPVSIVEVAYTARGDAAVGQAWKDFAIQYSDNGTDWTTAWSVTGQVGWSLGETRVFTKP